MPSCLWKVCNTGLSVHETCHLFGFNLYTELPNSKTMWFICYLSKAIIWSGQIKLNYSKTQISQAERNSRFNSCQQHTCVSSKKSLCLSPGFKFCQKQNHHWQALQVRAPDRMFWKMLYSLLTGPNLTKNNLSPTPC